MDINKFLPVTKLVINKLEGGYFHPNMRTANPSKFGVYHRSGETMMGLDRHAGHSLYYSTPKKPGINGKPITVLDNLKYIENGSYTYKSPEAKEFWTLIDNVKAKTNWKWNYKGGIYENKLTELASKIMFPSFIKNFNTYLKEPKAKLIVENDPRLLFHFIYATWNGPGFFKKFATDIDTAVKKGITDPNKLSEIALNSRINEGLKPGDPPIPLIVQGGKKIKEIFKTINNTISEKKKYSPIIFIGLLIGGYFLYKKYKK